MVIATAAAAAAPKVVESATDSEGLLNKILKFALVIAVLIGLVLGYMILTLVMDIAGVVSDVGGGLWSLVGVLFPGSAGLGIVATGLSAVGSYFLGKR